MPEPGAADAPTARRPRRRPGENRERLLEAGIREFGTLGYAGASTAAIAAAAAVPQPHVYANFKTKQALFLACAHRVCRELGSAELGSTELGRAPEQDAAQYRRFLLQAIAAAPRLELHEHLTPLLLELRETSGECFDAALVDAAISLLQHPGE